MILNKNKFCKMPLLLNCHNNFDMNLTNVLLISCHHVLDSNLLFLNFLNKKGLEYKNMYVLWKAYSTSYVSYKNYINNWIKINKQSLYFNSKDNFLLQYKKYVDLFISDTLLSINLKKYEKVIIRDDWWILLDNLSNKKINFDNIYWIEHTSNWFHRLNNKKINFPIINIARSNAKLMNESPFIAEVIIENFYKYYNWLKIITPKVLVIGWWAIWKSIYNILKQNFNITIYDIKPELSKIEWKIEDIINDYDLVFWCTWTEVITFDLFKKIREWVVFISASSWDYEFPSFKIRLITKKYNWIWDNLNFEGKVILNWWFPINFSWSPHSVSFEKIQLTRWLIYGWIYQIMNNKNLNNWFNDLDLSIQKFLIQNFKY